MVEALNTCRSMHITHNKKQHMHEYAHAQGGNRPTEKVATERMATENTLTYKHKQAVPNSKHKHTQTVPSRHKQAQTKEAQDKKQQKVHSDNGQGPQYIHYACSNVVLAMVGW